MSNFRLIHLVVGFLMVFFSVLAAVLPQESIGTASAHQRILPTADSAILQFSDTISNGAWEAVASPTTSRLTGVSGSSSGNAYIVGGNYFQDEVPIILRDTPNGWVVDETVNQPFRHFTSVSFGTAQSGWAVGYQLASRFNNGAWEHQDVFNHAFSRVVMLDEDKAWRVGRRWEIDDSGLEYYGTIQEYQSGIWQEQASQADESYLDISMANEAEGWVVGATGGIITRNKNDVANGKEISSELTEQQGIILHRASTSAPWTQVFTAPAALWSVDHVGANDVWAVGEGGLILHYSGQEWETVASPTSQRLKRIYMSSTNEGWIVGDSGTILRYSGTAWKLQDSPTQADLDDVTMLANGEGWIVGQEGAILKYVRSATLTINHATGAPGSYFELHGDGFPESAEASVMVNGRELGTVSTNGDGAIVFTLSTEMANGGRYTVTVSVNPSATAHFVLDESEPSWPQEGTGPVIEVPAGIALTEQLFAPAILR